MLWTWVFNYREVKVTWISMYSNVTYHSDSSKENFSSNLGHFTSLVWRPHRSQKNIKAEFLWDFLVRGPGLFLCCSGRCVPEEAICDDVSQENQVVSFCENRGSSAVSDGEREGVRSQRP